MNNDAVDMRAWLDTHDLADSELLHSLPNHGLDGADRLTNPERLLLSGLLEARRAIVPGYRPTPADRSTASQDRPEVAEPAGLFDPDLDRARERAAVEPASHRARPAGPVARHHPQPPTACRHQQHEREQEPER